MLLRNFKLRCEIHEMDLLAINLLFRIMSKVMRAKHAANMTSDEAKPQ